MSLRLSIDGGLTYVTIDEARLCYDIPGCDEELSIVATHEGLITDVTKGGEIVGSQSEQVLDIIDRLWEGD